MDSSDKLSGYSSDSSAQSTETDSSDTSSIASVNSEVSSCVAETDSDDDSISPIQPYQFEPSGELFDNASSSEESCSEEGECENDERLANTDWCHCGNCVVMPTGEECICCCEITQMVTKLEETGAPCIIEHAGFDAVCLNRWVLQTAYYQYNQQYGKQSTKLEVHEQYRFIAYRQLTRWCWGWLGKSIRVVLPSCAVTAIRAAFPSEHYSGFKYPDLTDCS